MLNEQSIPRSSGSIPAPLLANAMKRQFAKQAFRILSGMSDADKPGSPLFRFLETKTDKGVTTSKVRLPDKAEDFALIEGLEEATKKKILEFRITEYNSKTRQALQISPGSEELNARLAMIALHSDYGILDSIEGLLENNRGNLDKSTRKFLASVKMQIECKNSATERQIEAVVDIIYQFNGQSAGLTAALYNINLEILKIAAQFEDAGEAKKALLPVYFQFRKVASRFKGRREVATNVIEGCLSSDDILALFKSRSEDYAKALQFCIDKPECLSFLLRLDLEFYRMREGKIALNFSPFEDRIDSFVERMHGEGKNAPFLSMEQFAQELNDIDSRIYPSNGFGKS